MANLHLSADSQKNLQQPSRRSHRQEQLRICENLLLERPKPIKVHSCRESHTVPYSMRLRPLLKSTRTNI